MLILRTKLHIPPPRPKRVFRSDLVNKLNNGLHGKLTLISAPAGSGKTTLLSEWITSCEQSVAWLSLDSQDNDQARFLAYLIAAFQTVSPNFGTEILKSINSPEPLPTESVLTLLINEIGTFNNNVILVLDDYHLIASESVDNILTFLLEHLPPQLHIVIAARRHPNFPIARLRSQDQMTELVASDLRFTSSQITEFLNKVIGLGLTTQNIDRLEKRTEGWIAGLQLTALALQGSQNATDFINSFTGSHHFVIDYLVEEVLQLQSAEVTSFLLKTSILNRFCSSLCDAVLLTPSGASREILDYLEQSNLLVVPLDNKRQWYRYHHLFGDALHARLIKEQPSQVAALHRQASLWYEQNGFRNDAIEHALTAEDYERAADLIDQDWVENSGTYFRSETWLGWVKALPDEFVQNRPRLSLVFIWELLFFGELEAAEARVNELDRLLAFAQTDETSAEMQVVNEDEYRSLRASLAIAQAFHAQAQGDIDDTVKHTRQALTFVSETDYHTQGLANSLQGLAHLTQGDLDIAFQKMAEGKANMHRVENLLLATSSTFVLANIRVTQGRLHDAIATYKQALQHLSNHQGAEIPGTADLYLGLSELYHEQGKIEVAAQHLERCEALGKPAALPEWPYPLYLVQARLKQSNGDLDGTLELLSQAEGYYQRGPVPNLRPVAALKARLLAVQGKITEALAWANTQNLSVEDALSYLHEFEHITLARILTAQFQHGGVPQHIGDALALLKRLQKAAEDGGRNGSLIEILILQALAHQAQGNLDLAHQPLAMALSLAEPEGYVRLFVNEGQPMAELLRAAEARGITPTYTRTLLAIFDAEKQQRFDQANISMQSSAPERKSMVEPLSERELEILSLIAVGKKNQEIADQLIISLNTIRYHTKNLYGKLGVNKRTQAVAKAQELGLI